MIRSKFLGKLKISEIKEDIDSLKKEQFDLQQNVIDLKKTLEQNTKEYDSFESKISNGKQELDNIQKTNCQS